MGRAERRGPLAADREPDTRAGGAGGGSGRRSLRRPAAGQGEPAPDRPARALAGRPPLGTRRSPEGRQRLARRHRPRPRPDPVAVPTDAGGPGRGAARPADGDRTGLVRWRHRADGPHLPATGPPPGKPNAPGGAGPAERREPQLLQPEAGPTGSGRRPNGPPGVPPPAPPDRRRPAALARPGRSRLLRRHPPRSAPPDLAPRGRPAPEPRVRPQRAGASRWLRAESPPSDSNRHNRLYKRRALPVELGGQFMVGRPANPLELSVRRGIHTQESAARADLVDANSIDPIRAGTVDEEEIDLIGVVRGVNHAAHVCSGATGGELDHAS